MQPNIGYCNIPVITITTSNKSNENDINNTQYNNVDVLCFIFFCFGIRGVCLRILEKRKTQKNFDFEVFNIEKNMSTNFDFEVFNIEKNMSSNFFNIEKLRQKNRQTWSKTCFKILRLRNFEKNLPFENVYLTMFSQVCVNINEVKSTKILP